MSNSDSSIQLYIFKMLRIPFYGNWKNTVCNSWKCAFLHSSRLTNSLRLLFVKLLLLRRDALHFHTSCTNIVLLYIKWKECLFMRHVVWSMTFLENPCFYNHINMSSFSRKLWTKSWVLKIREIKILNSRTFYSPNLFQIFYTKVAFSWCPCALFG